MSTKKSYISSMAFKYRTKPLEHQREALIKGAKSDYFFLTMGMGTGKTKVAIDNAVYLWTEKKINVVLAIAPNSVTHNWMHEINTHSSARNKIYIHKVDKFDYDPNLLNWYIMNVESFSIQSGMKVAKKLVQDHEKNMFMVIDESTTIKNPKAKRTKNIIKLAENIIYKRAMTGSPVTKNPLDLYAQCEFLKKGLLGFSSYYSFRARYAKLRPLTRDGFRQTMIPYDYQNVDELKDKIKSFSYRAIKENCLDLPPKIYVKRYVHLSKEQIEIYANLKKYARAVFQNKESSYTNKLTELLRLHQVTCGFFCTDNKENKELDNNKIKELINVIDETEGKIIIWANYIFNLEHIIKTLRKKYPEDKTVAMYGAVSVEDRDRAVKDFQNDKYTRFFVGNPSTGGYGLNLTAAQTVIYYSNSFDLTHREQSEDRAHRKGQNKSVTYVDIVTKGTIDEFILDALNKKKTMSSQVLGEIVLNFL